MRFGSIRYCPALNAWACQFRSAARPIIFASTFCASCSTGQWIRQRSRWIKGYMQTLLVHTRRPLHFLRTAGPLGFLGFVFFIGGTVFAGLLNPIFWLFYLIWLAAAAASFDP